MTSRRHPVRILAALAASAAGLLVGPTLTHASAAAAFCSPPSSFTGTTITWTGNANSNNWDKAANWNPHKVPDAHHTKATYANQYVCIGKPATVEITKHTAVHVAGIDIGNGAQLIVEPGAGLFLGSKPGDPVMNSYVRAGSQLQLLAGALGGNSP